MPQSSHAAAFPQVHLKGGGRVKLQPSSVCNSRTCWGSLETGVESLSAFFFLSSESCSQLKVSRELPGQFRLHSALHTLGVVPLVHPVCLAAFPPLSVPLHWTLIFVDPAC